MLYISRYIYMDKFGVVDSETDIAQVVDCDWIEKGLKKGEKILGVNIDEDEKKLFRYLIIHPYQFDVLPIHTKTSLLKHVDVTTYHSWITSISWRVSDITKPVSIRLSEFGSKLSDNLLIRNTECSEKKVTLVFDSNIQSISTHAFDITSAFSPPIYDLGIQLDVRELEYSRLLTHIYERVIRPTDWAPIDCFKDIIIDRPGRAEVMLKKIGVT